MRRIDKVTRQLRLMDLEKELKYKGYDDLGLRFLGSLREEVKVELKNLKNEPERESEDCDFNDEET